MRAKVGEVRNSQLISTFGPGAIMDLPDFSVIIASLDHWDQKQCRTIKEPRLQKKLKISKIYEPPFLEGEVEKQMGTLPAFRFPTYLVCPKCRKLAIFKDFYIDEETQISTCHCETGTRVFPARFITACAKGHIEDFPWHFYAHSKKGNLECKGDLFLNDKGATGSISDVEVECKECGEKRTLEDAFTGIDLPSCRGSRYWMGPSWSSREDCSEKSRALLRGASNLYFPIVSSALSIPPYTNPIHQVVADEMERLGKVGTKEKLQMYIEDELFPTFNDYGLDELWQVITHQRNLGEGEDLDLLFPEWEALHRGENEHAEFEFETEEQSVPKRYANKFSRLIMVKRLTEVRVLDGFSRIEPLPDVTSMDEEDETIKDSFKASLSEKRLNWRPGLVTRGEGIFIALNESEVAKWELRIEAVGKTMEQAFSKYCKDRNLEGEPQFPGVRYVLLHTLSHALMRQLCLSSGYSSTSIRERIYSRNVDGQKMAGILLYTATPDSEGSLGGLVELGKTDKFEEVLFHALEDAKFCSGDPLCAEHVPNAMGDLNGAACHACQLAAETSCEKSNRFLDRTFLVPTVSNAELAYFNV